MKKITACLLLLALPLLSGCEKRLFHFIVTIDKTPTFAVDQTGAFDEAVVITSQDVLSALDIPEDARITSIDVEGLALKVVVKPGNQAARLKVSGEIYDVGQNKSKMFENYPIVLAGVDVPFIGLNALIEAGISKLRSKLNGYVKNLDNSAFVIEVSGDSDPPGQRVVLDLQLKIKATVKYDQCVEVPQLFSSGEECDIE